MLLPQPGINLKNIELVLPILTTFQSNIPLFQGLIFIIKILHSLILPLKELLA